MIGCGKALRWGVRLAVLTVCAAWCLAAIASAQDGDGRHEAVWKKIAPFFQPPAESAKDPTSYRSPLLFDDDRREAIYSYSQSRLKRVIWVSLNPPVLRWPAQ